MDPNPEDAKPDASKQVAEAHSLLMRLKETGTG